MTHRRRLPFGAEVQPGGGTHFRVWAPGRKYVEVTLESGAVVVLGDEGGGFFSGLGADVRAGALYRLRLDNGPSLFPDPASRFQIDGPHGPSQVIDPGCFRWTDGGWPGLDPDGQVLYEMHVGTFTAMGTWTSAAARLPELVELGITAVALLPVADFPGHFGWGHDGVCLFAPTRLYGTPDDMRWFVDEAHRLGIGVILEVVYHRAGPEGGCLHEFAPPFFRDPEAAGGHGRFNFDGTESPPVREFFRANAAHWVNEYHLDGIRLSGTSEMLDRSPEHVIAAVARAAREAGGGRRLFLMADGEGRDGRLVRPPGQGGYGLDGVSNDDLHHAARVALTGRCEGYFSAYRGSAQEFVSAAKWGFLYQGQANRWQRRRSGTPSLDVPPRRFISFLEDHSQVAGCGRGPRLVTLASPGRYRAMTTYLLLGPGTPMLFQGQEYGSPRPFLYFADHGPDLAREVLRERREALRRFRSQAREEAERLVPDPADQVTFARCKLVPEDRYDRPEWVALHRDLIGLRRADPAFRAGRPDGAVLGAAAFVLRYFEPGGADRLLVVNLGSDLTFDPAPEPLLGPPRAGTRWHPIWSSEALEYGGLGTANLDGDDGWMIPGEAAVVLAAR